MKYLPSRIRDIPFWYYHCTGWLLYSGAQLGLYIAWRGFMWKPLLSISIQLIVIFFLLLGMRRYYQRIPFQTMSLIPLLSRVVIVSFLTTVIWLFFWAGIEYSIFTKKLLEYISVPVRVASRLSLSFPIFLGWSALYFGIKAWRDWLNERDQTEHATEAVQRAQLQMLRYQLNPHFLFNALNSVRALVDEDARSAKTMITELSEFLRYSLMSRNKPIVTLKDELDAIRLYLSIEQQRYEDKLQISYDIGPGSEDVPVPSFLIHPIVEYALRCGMQTSSMPIYLKIESQIIENQLRIAVLHSGCNMPSNGNGISDSGIEQVKARLEELFPNKYRLYTFQNNGQAQTILELAILNGVTNEKEVASNYSR
jgi:hypothetical protein